MSNVMCPKCNIPMEYISPGISKKTGKPYSGFWACPNRECKETFNPPKASPPEEQFSRGLEEDKEKEKWDKIGRGKTRCALAVALINAGLKSGEESEKELDLWTESVLGKTLEEIGDSVARPLTEEEKKEIPPEEFGDL